MRGDGPYYLLLDEVQFMPRLEEVLTSLLRMSNIDVYVTGSNSSSFPATSGPNFAAAVTRYAFIRCRLQSSISVWDGDFDDAWDEYMLYGGLPQIVKFSERTPEGRLSEKHFC